MQTNLRYLCIFGWSVAVTYVVACSSSGDKGFEVRATGGTGVASGGSSGIIFLKGGSAGNPCTGPNPPETCELVPSGPACGDGKINQASEVCDDGNSVPGDGCTGVCKVEPHFECPTEGQLCVSSFRCGNGAIEPGEVCDDGNTTPEDGCSADCTVQSASFNCPVAGQPCLRVEFCGNKRVKGDETCDDGNTTPLDGCDENCHKEVGWLCVMPGAACQRVKVCGDGIQSPELGEQCDDGNSESKDGCSADCKAIESGFQCSVPGKLCENTNRCGDGRVTGAETCDDANDDLADGCEDCRVTPGYDCPFPGAKCIGKCGDGILLLNERCDDGNADDGDGCSSTCMWEKGWACTGNPGAYSCHATKCGDKKTEGTEGCDDGNHNLGDGCTPLCNLEPDCAAGACTSKCGDGIVLSGLGEACDDGNVNDGDGCSSTCKVESGYQCKQPPLGQSMVVPIVYRDFKKGADFEPAGSEGRTAALTGMVQPKLDDQGKPVFSAVTGSLVTSATSFAQWYTDVAGTNTTYASELKLWRRSDGSYVNRWGANGEQWRLTTEVFCGVVGQEIQGIPCTFSAGDTDCQTFRSDIVDCVQSGTQWRGILLKKAYDGNPLFFPLDDVPGMITPTTEYATATVPEWYGGGNDPSKKAHNFHFTSEARYWFAFDSTKTYKLDFTGDDDVWVFINKQLAVDLGGIHTPVNGSITLDANGNGTATVRSTVGTAAPITAPVTLNLKSGQVYEIVVFQAERRTSASSYMLTLSGFNASASVCGPICGDGVLAPGEQCDDGENLGGYGQCQPECVRGPYCGDAQVNGPEACDNGSNSSAYGSDGCAPGCVTPARCGDGIVQTEFGETCDDKVNDGSYGGCTNQCQFAARCGDGVVNGADEQCDDGANDGSYGNCAPSCKLGPRCGDGVQDEAFGEQCEDGNTTNGDGCSSNCRLEGVCGDTIVDKDAGEQCDDGVNDGGYGECGPSCQFGPRCGDGVKQSQEQCDGGENPTGGYGECAVGCVLGPHCGDGRVQTGYEECDDDNTDDRDGCSAACKTEIIQY